MSEFTDSSDWRNQPPALAAMLPVDGNYAVSQANAETFRRYRWYTVTGDYRRAGAIDWENGYPCFTPGGLRRFVTGRKATLH